MDREAMEAVFTLSLMGRSTKKLQHGRASSTLPPRVIHGAELSAPTGTEPEKRCKRKFSAISTLLQGPNTHGAGGSMQQVDDHTCSPGPPWLGKGKRSSRGRRKYGSRKELVQKLLPRKTSVAAPPSAPCSKFIGVTNRQSSKYVASVRDVDRDEEGRTRWGPKGCATEPPVCSFQRNFKELGECRVVPLTKYLTSPELVATIVDDWKRLQSLPCTLHR